MAKTDKSEQPKRRQRRPDGEQSRNRILDAATEIAAERGYEGTSIGAVSAKCGLPASSIYWHFKDKDDLIAAVIERSFSNWLKVWQLPDDVVARDRLMEVAAGTAKALLDSPDFLRLGLMLALERRPVEPRARAMFVQVRKQAFDALSTSIRSWARPDRRPGSPAGHLRDRRCRRTVHRQGDRRRQRRSGRPVRAARAGAVRTQRCA